MQFTINLSKKIFIFLIIFLTFDIIFFSLIPKKIKSELYNNRAHRIKSYFYHHDLRPMASFYDHWGYERYKIYTNNLGFKDKSNRKIEFNVRNLLFIGDSFTEGVGLKYGETYVGIIENELKKKYSNIEVLNAGVQSYSTSIYLSKIYHLIERKKLPITDIVVMISGGDVFDDAYKYKDVSKEFILNHVDQKNKAIISIINFYKSNTLTYQLISRITPPKVIPELIKSLFENKSKSTNYTEQEEKLFQISNSEIDQMNFMNLKDYSYLYSEQEFNDWGKKAIDQSIDNLERIIKISKKNNINLNVLYIFEPILILKHPKEKQLNYLLSKLKDLEKNNVKVNFIRDYYYNFENKYDAYRNLFFINDIHWNKRGNSFVAKEILNKIQFFLIE